MSIFLWPLFQEPQHQSRREEYTLWPGIKPPSSWKPHPPGQVNTCQACRGPSCGFIPGKWEVGEEGKSSRYLIMKHWHISVDVSCRWPLTVGEFDEMLCQIPFLQHLSRNERRGQKEADTCLALLGYSEPFVLLLVLWSSHSFANHTNECCTTVLGMFTSFWSRRLQICVCLAPWRL